MVCVSGFALGMLAVLLAVLVPAGAVFLLLTLAFAFGPRPPEPPFRHD